MKKIICCLLILAQYQLLTAQNVGIGTTTPNNSALLDLTSTNKGILIPRMTGAQRVAIAAPPVGLMVIQTNIETVPPSSPGLYLCEQVGAFTSWRRIARTDEITGGSSTWTVNGSNQFSNVAGNVGIGTGSPTTKLHLVGDLLQESGTMTINNAAATLQLQIAGVNKASMYLWSDNLRIGTNTGNTVGDVHIQTAGSIRLSVTAFNGNVGIGTLSPTEKLHVSGNILSSNRIDANGVIEGNGISSTGTLYVNSTSLLQGAVTGNSSATFNSTITSNTSMVVNDPASIFQLQNAGINKGFMQLSGDNLRIGTNSGNAAGNVILRMDGTDMINFQKTGSAGTFMQMNLNGVSTGVLQTTSTGNVSLTAVNANAQVQLGGEVFINNTAGRTGIGTSSPTERLHVNGKLKVSGTDMTIEDGRITGTATGPAYNLLPVCYGRVNENGTKAGGTQNFTVTHDGDGIYTITCPGITASSLIFVNPLGGSGTSPTWFTARGAYASGNTMEVYTSEFFNVDRTPSAFQFIIYTP